MLLEINLKLHDVELHYSEEQLLQEEQQQQQLLQNTQAQLQAQAVQNAVAATAYNLAGYEPLVYPSQLAQQSLAQVRSVAS